MPVSKLGQRRQVVIPKEICEELDLKQGDFVELARVKGSIVMKPMKLVDRDDVLSHEEEKLVEKGFQDLKRGEYVSWEELKNELDL